MSKLILASASPRRERLLRQAGLSFEIFPSGIDEEDSDGLSPYELVKTLSMQKAVYIADRLEEPAYIVAADTVVAIQGRILGKPKNEQDAFRMLHMLQGRKHTVYTGVTIINKMEDGLALRNIVDNTDVYMRSLTDSEIWAYVKSGEPLDKAGAYAIQERGALLVEKIEGDFYTIEGLPIVRVYLTLQEMGFSLI